ncbi:MAG: hypothetical protein BGN85_10900 [Alphaproteobacteria bacterium 64-11]|nr:type II secretion system F family protein [Alphaproteobacteria bacterium]OJU09388.1 MAG: hypothetical protein BGN85_10900 [Alphaproteobacteria bacterium 64-11]
MAGTIDLRILMFAGGLILFIAVVLLVSGVYDMLTQWRPSAQTSGGLSPESAGVQGKPLRASIEDEFLSKIADFVTPQDETERASIRLRLVRAGYRRPSAIRVFYLMRAICAFVFAFIGAVITAFVKIPLPLPILLGLLVFPFIIGFVVPPLWIDRCAERRRQEAEQAFPDVLDMLLVCIEAGQSFDQACRRVAREIGTISKVLYEELSLLNDELRAGRDRTAVFRDFATRLNVNDIRAFATVLRQSDEFGVSVADALRVYAADMRNKRLMRAEERANLMPLKLALGSMAFTVPPTMLIMAGPSLLMILRVFANMGGH